jgi:hypothetical protein
MRPLVTEVIATDAAPANGMQTAREVTREQIAFAVARRRASRNEEWQLQARVAKKLKRHLPAGCFATALENTPRNALSGLLQGRRGVRAGLPDWQIIWRGENIYIECKSLRGIASPAQRQIRDELLAAGVKFWWLVRSVPAFFMALHLSGVPLIKWRPPKKIERWEGPFVNPHARLPQHPVAAAERAGARKRCRERKREREAALAAEQSQAKNIDGAEGHPFDCDHGAVLGAPMYRTTQRWLNVREGSHARHSSHSDSEG